MFFKNFTVTGAAVAGVKMLANTPAATCSWNTFIHLTIKNSTNGKCLLWLSGAGGGVGNAAHNLFLLTQLNHGGTRHGVVLGACDNNVFDVAYISADPFTTGYGVYCDPSELTGFPTSNVFIHLQAGAGWFQPASTTAHTASIFGYQLDNGEPLPIASGTPLLFIDSGARIVGLAAPTWTNVLGGVNYQNGWVEVGGVEPVGAYLKDMLGFVHIKGSLKNGTINTTAFTLPIGFRPKADDVFPAWTEGNSLGQVVVRASGDVQLYLGSTVRFPINGVTFLGEQ